MNKFKNSFDKDKSHFMRIIMMVNILMMINIFAVFSQGIPITGVVRDIAGISLPGANIIVQGTTIGSIADANGRYSITVPNSDAVLIFSSIGFETQEIVVGDRRIIDPVMMEGATGIEEVVITALGIRRDTRALGYAISTIKGSDMVLAGNTVNPLTTLYGKAAGVGVTAGAAGPTGGVNIRVRGAASLSSDQNIRPLFVVDGVPVRDRDSDMSSRGWDPLNSFDFGSGINNINPEDIESMEILKGAKASVLYGGEGANGVVLITTKRGSGTRGLGVTVNYQSTIEQPFSYLDFQNEFGSGANVNAWRETDGQRQVVMNRYSFGPRFDGSPIMFVDGSIAPYQAYPNNFIDMFRRGNSNNVSIAIAGGNERGNMRVAYTNYNYNGIMENFWQKRNTLSFSGQMQVSEFASFEINSNLFSVNTHNRLPNIQQIVAWGVHRDFDYQKIKDVYMIGDFQNEPVWDDWGLQESAREWLNVWWNQNNNSNLDAQLHNITSVRLTLNFTPWLYFVGQGGLDIQNTNFTTKRAITREEPYRGGRYAFRRTNSLSQNYEGFLNFDNHFLNDDLHVHIFGGYGYRSNADNDISVATEGGLAYPGWYSLDAGVGWPSQDAAGNVRGHSRGSDVLYSVFGAATFGWKNTYYVEISARNDWSSTLPPANNSYFYPGVSFTWNFTENFDIPYVNYGKLYASFADVGRAAPRYYTYRSYDIRVMPNDPSIRRVSGPGDLFAGDIRPERKREFEIGFNTRLLPRNRLEVNFSFYNNNVYDQIMGVPLSGTVGASNIRINAGDVRNWGYELFVKGAPVIGVNYKWDLTFTMANQYSQVQKLYPGITRIPLGGSGYQVVADEGKRYGEILMYDYDRAPDGSRLVTQAGNYRIIRDEFKPINKNVNPDFFGGIMSNFYWKGFYAFVGLDYKFGGSIFSYSNYYMTALGQGKNTLKYRDEQTGGIPYYRDENDNTVRLNSHSDTPPNGATRFHNGMILKGSKVLTNDAGQPILDASGEPQYVENDIVLPSSSYYQTFLDDMSGGFQPDALFRNDYIKLREVAIGYTLPASWTERVKIQKVTVSLVARNLFYLYKTLPHVDAESILGTRGQNAFHEQSFLPTIRTYGFGVNVSF